jgi:hypothetical protein
MAEHAHSHALCSIAFIGLCEGGMFHFPFFQTLIWIMYLFNIDEIDCIITSDTKCKLTLFALPQVD